MAYKPRFNTKRRESLYQRETLAAYKAGLGLLPICPHCNLPVEPTQAWDEVHVGAPKCFDGRDTQVGHRLCNRLDNNHVVTPMAAKARRVKLRHLGVTGPGLGRHPLPAGKRSDLTRTIAGQLRPRQTQSQKLAATLAKRSFAEVVSATEGVE